MAGLAAAPVSAGEDYDSLLSLFDYDQTVPLDVQIARSDTITDHRAVIHHVNFASPVAGRVTALLVIPEEAADLQGEGRAAGSPVRKHAGIVFLHWGQGDQSEFVSEALLYSRAGAVSILVDAPWTRPAPWTQPGEDLGNPEQSRQMYIQNVKDLRRAVDLLLQRGDVDPARIAYVGHSFGATQGGVFAGVEKRVKTFILMAGLPSLVDFSATGARKFDEMGEIIKKYLSAEQWAAYVEAIAPLAPADFVGHAPPSSVFMQFGTYDSWIPKASAEQFFAAAAEPKRIKWYVTSHEFTDLAAVKDRARWLEQEIGIGSVTASLRELLQ